MLCSTSACSAVGGHSAKTLATRLFLKPAESLQYHSRVEVNDLGFVTSHGKSKPSPAANVYYVTKKYFTHKTSVDLKKTIAFLGGK